VSRKNFKAVAYSGAGYIKSQVTFRSV